MTLQNLLRIGRLKEHQPTQSLPLTVGAGNDVWVVLDALRRQRNANDYTGQPITPAAVAECIGQAKGLRALVHAHLKVEHPDLLRAAK